MVVGGWMKVSLGLMGILLTSALWTAKRNSPVNNQCSPGGSANPGPMVSAALGAQGCSAVG